MRPEIVYVPIRDPEVRSAVLACCISDEAPPSMAVSVRLQDLRSGLERWYRRAQRSRSGSGRQRTSPSKPRGAL